MHFTTKSDAVHVFIPVNGEPGELAIKALGTDQFSKRSIASIKLLGSDEKVKWTEDGDHFTLTMPIDVPGIIATYRVELRK